MFENFKTIVEAPITRINPFDLIGDERTEPRQKCYKTGKIIVSDLGPSYNCVFKDLSWFGVRLEMGTFIPLPSRFQLALTHGKNTKSFQCKQIWRNGNEIGVIFEYED